MVVDRLNMIIMGNKYVLLTLGLLSVFFSIYGGYLKMNKIENGNIFLIISVFITPLFLISLLLYIKRLRKKQ